MCNVHPDVTLQTVCGESVCGMCYADSMVRQRVPSKSKHPGRYTLTAYNKHGFHYSVGESKRKGN